MQITVKFWRKMVGARVGGFRSDSNALQSVENRSPGAETQ